MISSNRRLARYDTGDATQVIIPIAFTPPEISDVLCRVSHSDQDKAGNLLVQQTFLPLAIQSKGGTVGLTHSFVQSGYGDEWFHELWLLRNGMLKRGTYKLTASMTDRFARNLLFRSNESVLCRMQASESDLMKLAEVTEGIQLMTLLHPNASPKDCKSLRANWGNLIKERKGGRPLKGDKYNAKWKPVAMEMASSGMKSRQIAAKISKLSNRYISHVSVWKWLTKDGVNFRDAETVSECR